MADRKVRQKFEAWKESVSNGGRRYVTHFDAFEAGMRAGEIAMREKAAKTMESLSANWVSSLPMDEVQSLNCKQYARAIRALPLSGAEESKTS